MNKPPTHTHKDTKKRKKGNKKKYKVTNWHEYNKALIQRGSIILWIGNDIKRKWLGSGKYLYSDHAIEAMLMMQAVYGLPLRAAVGLVRSLFEQTGILLDVPDYTTLSRRAQSIKVTLKKRYKGNIHLILDSTGAKIYGEGEWKVRKHGWSKRRTWKKLHIGIDADGEIRAVEVTDNDVHDSEMVPAILAQEDEAVTNFYGDGAYDTFDTYDALKNRGVNGFHIPPQKNAKIHQHGNTKAYPYPRDENLRAIRKTTRKRWKEASGYHTRSLGENVMFRFKTIFGGSLAARSDATQTTEVMVKCNVLNTFFTLGMPQTIVAT